MEHSIHLDSEPFELIKKGIKKIEMRLNDEKRRRIKIGDIIIFTNRDNNMELKVRVLNLYRFKDFKELYDYFDKELLGYLEEEANPSDMEMYYSPDMIKKYGVLGIEVEVI